MGYFKVVNDYVQTCSKKIDDTWFPITRDQNGNIIGPSVLVTQIADEQKATSNAKIMQQITALESELIRPMRELLSSIVTDKTYAQTKVNDIETKIEALRAQIV
ncbi:MAG: hypothetical protein R3331_02105 [Sulfurospirillaceae bacterium]|nr:hypothetical protein [Sulfurospirillaceae bacterium]